MSEFVHLHNHSDFSLLDGAAPIPGYIRAAEEYGMKHLGLTDHGNMFGALRFEQACRSAGINPVVGSEMYVAPGSRTDRSQSGQKNYHLCLYCRNETGYNNLMVLSSRSYTEGFYYKPRIDDELLEEYHEGLIASSACLAGEIPRAVLAGNREEAKAKALYYRDLFGEGSFYLELMDHGIPEEKTVKQELIQISRETGIPLIATNDIHYLRKDHANAHDILLCIGTNKKKSEENRMRMDEQEYYFKSPEEMEALFSDVPEALENTVRLAEKCDLHIPQPGPILPHYGIPPEFPTPEDYMRHLVWEGLKDRYGELTEEIEKRAEYEMETIIGMGFTGYFLIVWDFIAWAKNRGIPVGPGRGSGAGSIVAYAMTITDIDPLRYGLLFERFLNPERVSMPDFDVDFCFERRNEVIDYVTRKYGQPQVAGICTFGTLKTKAALKDVARVLDIPFDESNKLTDQIPTDMDIPKDWPKTKTEFYLENSPELQGYYSRGGVYEELFRVSAVLEGMNRHVSTHACGMVIGKTRLTDYVPLYRDAKTGSITSQYTMDIIEPCGLVKMDFLGLKTLTLLSNIERLVQKHTPEFSTDAIPEDDAATFEMLGRGESTAVFQFESSGMQDILARAKPNSIEEMIALNALYRPGPMKFIPQYIDSKMGRQEISYPHPDLKEVLEPTFGVIVYQEQVMKVAQIIGGFSLGKADILRRAMGKKKEKELLKMEVEFLDGAEAKGYGRDLGKKVFELLKPFAGYGFNKSHAAAYSIVAYKTAYCRANFPAEFMAANLTNEISNPDAYAGYLAEARKMGIEIAPPDINLSEQYFTVADGRIIYGLVGIKNVGSAAVEKILEVREKEGRFTSFYDFLEKVDLRAINHRVLETMIYAGLFDTVEEQSRSSLIHNLDGVLDHVTRKKEAAEYGQVSLFESCEQEIFPDFEYEEAEEWPRMEILRLEKESLGFYVSGHPLDAYRKAWEKTANLNLKQASHAMTEKVYSLLGMIKSTRTITTKNGRQMAFAQFEDFNGSIELVIFSRAFEKYGQYLETDAVVGVTGKVDLSRDEPKLKVEEIKPPDELKEVKSSEVHIRMAPIEYSEDDLLELRDFLIDHPGSSPLYFHLNRPRGEVVVRPAVNFTITSGRQALDELKSYPKVEAVWKE